MAPATNDVWADRDGAVSVARTASVTAASRPARNGPVKTAFIVISPEMRSPVMRFYRRQVGIIKIMAGIDENMSRQKTLSRQQSDRCIACPDAGVAAIKKGMLYLPYPKV